MLIALPVVFSACQSTPELERPQAAPVEYYECNNFFVYDICLADIEGDGDVDYVYFGDDLQIFMWREGVALPDSMPLHRCRRPMTPEVAQIGSDLLYNDEDNLLREMDLKRRLLFKYLGDKDQVDECYGGDSSKGIPTDVVEDDFSNEDFDWDE
ncbi:MAG: hypothetical protein AAGI24_00490 [Pseudomonadota bacterium]